MATLSEQIADVLRDFVVDGVPASGANDPDKAQFRALLINMVTAIAAAQAGITIVPDIAARDAFYSNPDNRGKLVYVNNNNGVSDDPENGVYEYVNGAPRFADSFAKGVSLFVQPLVDQAKAWAESDDPPEVQDSSSKSAKTWAGLAADAATANPAAIAAAAARDVAVDARNKAISAEANSLGYAADAAASRAAAQDAASQAVSAANASTLLGGMSKTYPTYAAANADLANIADDASVLVLADEDNGGAQAIYQKVSAALSLVSVIGPLLQVMPPASGSAAIDTTALKAALQAGRAPIYVTPGTYLIDDTIVCQSNTNIQIGRGVVLKKADGTNKPMFVDQGWLNTDIAVTSLTSVSHSSSSPPDQYYLATAVCATAHGLAVGDRVIMRGATTYGYQGNFVVESVPDANTITFRLLAIPGALTATCSSEVSEAEVYINDSGVYQGGTGHAVGDVVTFGGGTFSTPARATVTSVSGGVITGLSVTTPGVYTDPYAGGTAGTQGGAFFTMASTTGSGTGGTFRLTFVPGSTTVTTNLVARKGCENISITGPGLVDANFDGNPDASGTNTFNMIFNLVHGLTLKDLKSINVQKYAYYIVGAQHLTAHDLELYTDSDGIHITGPVRHADIRNIKGKSLDDMVALVNGEWHSYNPDNEHRAGDFEHVTIDGVYADGSLTIGKVTGQAPYLFRDIAWKNLHGWTILDVISMEEDQYLPTCAGTIMTVDEVHAEPGAAHMVVHARNARFDVLKITNASRKIGNGAKGFFFADGMARIGQVIVDTLTNKGAEADVMHAIQFNGPASADDVFARNATLMLKSTAGASSVIGVIGKASVKRALLEGSRISADGTTIAPIYRQGYLDSYTVRDTVIDGMNGVYLDLNTNLTDPTTGAFRIIKAHLRGVTVKNGPNGIATYAGQEIHSTQVDMTGISNAALVPLAGNTGGVRLVGDLDIPSAATLHIAPQNGVGGVYPNSLNGPALKGKATALTPVAGDIWYNTDSGASPGVGLCFYEGGSLRRSRVKFTAQAFAASWTPDIGNGNIIQSGPITANMTVNAPAWIPPIGERIILRLPMGGTLFTVNWDAVYLFPNNTPPAPAINTALVIEFKSTGAQLIAEGAATWES